MNDDLRAGKADEFAPEERAALAAWSVPGAPLDSAERVMARAFPAPGLAARRGLWLRAAAILVVSGAAWWAFRQAYWPGSGDWSVAERTTVNIGGRGVAVAEAGSRATYQVSWRGSVRVYQNRGKVFYRVEPGGQFVVETPIGIIRVTGTCFQVEVMAMNKTAIKHGTIGAGVATMALLTVYEGQVIARTAQQSEEVSAGERATLDERGVWLVAPSRRRTRSGVPGPTRAGLEADESHTPSGADGAPTYDELARDRALLQHQVWDLEDRVEALQKKTRVSKTYDLTDAELSEMAQKCEVRWDWVVPDPAKPPTINDKDAEALQLTRDQRAALDQVLQQYNHDLSQQIRKLYSELTGDPNVGSMAVESMVSEAMDKTPRQETLRVYYTLAHERAGLLPSPADLSTLSRFEQMFRLVHGAGDQLEAEMAAVVGPELGASVRGLHGGFGSKSRLRNGCPDPTP